MPEAHPHRYFVKILKVITFVALLNWVFTLSVWNSKCRFAQVANLPAGRQDW